MLETLLPRLQGFEILEQGQRRANHAYLRVPKAQLLSLLGLLEQQQGFVTLTTICCSDWIEEEVFRLTYLLENATRDRCLGVQIQIARDGEDLASVIPLWPQAEIFERELNEMFGIPIAGHPSLGDFMLEDWPHTPPMRREFDTLEFVQETYEMRAGRDDNQNVREAIRKRKEAKKARQAQQRDAGSR